MNATKRKYIILHSVRSAYNVGSIFRTADAAGVSKIYLCGYTPTPVDRFGRKRRDIAKVALGAEETVPWEYFKTTKEAVGMLQEDNVEIIAVEQSEKAIDYLSYTSPQESAYIFGNEREGVPEDLQILCDKVIHIPMYGTKESLNVSVSVGIILFSC